MSGPIAYTCPCGATALVCDDGKLNLPASFYQRWEKEKPHIDYYLGTSDHRSAEKRGLYQVLRKRGCVWSWECEKCKGRFLARLKAKIRLGIVDIQKLRRSLRKLLYKKPWSVS